MLVLARLFVMFVFVFTLGLFPGSTHAEEKTCSPYEGCYTFQVFPSEVEYTYEIVDIEDERGVSVSWNKGVYSPTFHSKSGIVYRPYKGQTTMRLPPGSWTMRGYSLYVSPEDSTFKIQGNISTKVFAPEWMGLYITNTQFHTFNIDSPEWIPLGTVLSSTTPIKMMWDKDIEVKVLQGEITDPFNAEKTGKGWGIWNDNKGYIEAYLNPDYRYIVAKGKGRISYSGEQDIDIYRPFSIPGKGLWVLDNSIQLHNTLELFKQDDDVISSSPRPVSNNPQWRVTVIKVENALNVSLMRVTLPVEGRVYMRSFGPEVWGSSRSIILPQNPRADGYVYFDESQAKRNTVEFSATGSGLIIFATRSEIEHNPITRGYTYLTDNLPYIYPW